MKRIMLVLLQLLLGIMLFWAQNSEIKSNSGTEPTSKQIMDNFTAETNFLGTYTLSGDERIFSELIGTFPLPQVTGQKIFITNCDSLIKIIIKLYGKSAEVYSMSYPEKIDVEGSINENREFSSWSAQIYNGYKLIVMDNQEAQNYSWYKDYTENPDSCTWYGEYFEKKERNKEIKIWRHDSETHPIMGRIVIHYIPKDEKYFIENKMFLKPVALPILKVTKDDALTIASEKYKGPAYVRDLKLYVMPKDEYRTDFDLRFIWSAGSSSRYSGIYYSIDGTTGKILLEDYWIE